MISAWRGGRRRRQDGFTLIEVLVVIGLVAMLSLAVLVVPVWVDDRRQMDGDMARLADTLTLLNEQSLFSGRLMALRVTERGWEPMEYDVGERDFLPAEGNGLRALRLPPDLELVWELEELDPRQGDEQEQVSLDDVADRLVSDDAFGDDRGLLDQERQQAEEREDDEEEQQEEEELLPQVFFFPSGETTPATFTLRSLDDLELEVRRRLSALGRVTDPDSDEQEERLTAPEDRDGEDGPVSRGGFLEGDD